MAKTASTLLTNVLARVRDPNATALATNTPPTTASGNAFGFVLLTQAQYFVNAAGMTIISSATLTLTPRVTLYPVFSNLASCIKVTAVQSFGQKDLYMCNWKSFGRADRKWLVTVGSEPRNWATIGNDLLAIVPAVDVATNAAVGALTVNYVKLTNTISAGGNTFDLPDDQLGLVETLASALAMLKTKQLADFENAMTRLSHNFAQLKVWDIDAIDKAN